MRRLVAAVSSLVLATSAFAAPPAIPPMGPAQYQNYVPPKGAATTIQGGLNSANFNSLPLLSSSYLGNVITGTGVPSGNGGTLVWSQTRTPVYTRDTLSTGVVVGVPCFWVAAAASNEEHITTTGIHKVSLEDASGNITPVTFASASTGSCANAVNGVLVSDPVTMVAPIPSGSLMWFKDLYNDANGILTYGHDYALDSGGSFVYTTGTLTDLSATPGPFTSSGGAQLPAGNSFVPLFIATQTRVRSFCLYGTSRTFGSFDYHNGGGNVDLGNLARSIGPYAAYINAGVIGDTTGNFIASHAARASLDTYCSDDVIELAINDLDASVIAATIEANLNTIRGYLGGGHKVSLPTTEPRSTLTAVAVSTLVANGNGLALTVASPLGSYAPPGSIITVSGATPSTDNGTCSVVSNTATTINCLNPLATGTATATGTITFTDGFASFINQTADANVANLIALNDWKRSIPAGFYSAPEIYDVVATGRTSGKWNTAPCEVTLGALDIAAITGTITHEGLHENLCGYLRVQSSGAMSAAKMN